MKHLIPSIVFALIALLTLCAALAEPTEPIADFNEVAAVEATENMDAFEASEVPALQNPIQLTLSIPDAAPTHGVYLISGDRAKIEWAASGEVQGYAFVVRNEAGEVIWDPGRAVQNTSAEIERGAYFAAGKVYSFELSAQPSGAQIAIRFTFCAHREEIWTRVDAPWVPNDDGRTHSRTGELYQEKDCLVCGATLSSTPTGKIATETRSHRFVNGVCSVCGANNACAHLSGSYTRVIREGEYKDSGDGKHQFTGREYTVITCLICGQEIARSENTATASLPHSFVNGACEQCGAKNTCAHAHVSPDPWIDGVYRDDGNTTHTITGTKYEDTVCDDCGELLARAWQGDSVSETYYHYYGADGKDAACRVCGHVKPATAPKKVALSPSGTLQLSLGETLTLRAVFTPSDASAALTWSSSKPAVATVDATGAVTPIAEGKTKISVATSNKKKATVTLQVVDPNRVTKIAFAQKTATVAKGETILLTPALTPAAADASTLRWSSAKPAVATVDATGAVTGAAEGKVKITVSAPSGKKATVTVNVIDPKKPDGVRFAQSTLTLKAGETLALQPALSPATAEATYAWKSAKPKIASVDADGTVTAVSKGKAKITVTTHNKKKATITIVVTD
ncbi:MAG: Ig domain-containing protein [Clostridia bacterium]|nr:Ig domain-containing protein [Clostridia bacterium]